MASGHIRLHGSMDSLDSFDSNDSRRRREGYLVNNGFSSSDESESDGSSATSGYGSRASSLPDLSVDLIDDSDRSVMFESTKSVLHTLEYILCVQEMCDVTILAGRKKEPIHGLQAVMAARSRYFYELFESSKKKKVSKAKTVKRSILSIFQKKTTPEVRTQIAGQPQSPSENRVTLSFPEYEVDVLRKVVSFVHFGHVTVTWETVIGLICAATEFQLDDLRKACWDFVDRCLTSGNIKILLKHGAKYKKHPHVRLFIEMVSKMRQ